MTRAEGKLLLAERARVQRRVAELFSQLAHETAKLAEIEQAMASGAPADPGTGRKLHAPPEPEIPPPSELDRARARKALNSNRIARKLRR